MKKPPESRCCWWWYSQHAEEPQVGYPDRQPCNVVIGDVTAWKVGTKAVFAVPW